MPNRLSWTKHTDIPDAIPTDPARYPDHFIVVAKEVVKKTRKLFATDKKETVKGLHIYTGDSGVEDKLLNNGCRLLDYNVLYRHHLNREDHSYYPIMEFEDEMQRQRLQEIKDIFQYIVAYKVNIHYKSDESRGNASMQSASVETPIPGQPVTAVEATFESSQTRDSTSNRDSLVFFDNENFDPETASWPLSEDPLPTGWFFIRLQEAHGGIKNTFWQLVTTTIQLGHPTEKRLRMEFCATDSSHAARQFMASAIAKLAIMPSAGVAYSRDVNIDLNYSKTCSFDIEFFDPEVYARIRPRSENGKTRVNESVRMSLSGLAAWRFKHYGIQPQVREDLLFRQMKTAPSDETRPPPATWGEYFCGEKLQSKAFTVNIPLTIYGPSGSGKSSTIATWEAACNLTPFAFMEDLDSYTIELSIKPKDHTETIHRDTKFSVDPEVMENDATSHGENVKYYRSLEDYHQVRIILRDTYAAVGPNKDKDGAPLPLGMQILVLDAMKLKKEMDSGTTSYLDQCDNLIGPPVVRRYTRIAHYPPICILLAKSNSVENPSDVCDWTKSRLGVSCDVLEMPTFSVPTGEEQDKYLAAEPGTSYRKEYDEKWNIDALKSLTVLGSVLSAISSQECTLTKQELEDPGMLVRMLNGGKLKKD